MAELGNPSVVGKSCLNNLCMTVYGIAVADNEWESWFGIEQAINSWWSWNVYKWESKWYCNVWNIVSTQSETVKKFEIIQGHLSCWIVVADRSKGQNVFVFCILWICGYLSSVCKWWSWKQWRWCLELSFSITKLGEWLWKGIWIVQKMFKM